MSEELSRPSHYNGLATAEDWVCADTGKRGFYGNPYFKRKTMAFAGMMRIKNEGKWIKEVLDSILPLCDHVFILDDNSTDDTIAICKSFGSSVTVFLSPFRGMNESRDKNWLYDQIIIDCAPEWILCVDGDEVLEANGPRIIREYCAKEEAPNSYALKIEFLWNDAQTVRADRIYGDFWRPSLFRPQHEDPEKPDSRTLLREFRFMSTPFGRTQDSDQPNLHCSSVPQRLLHGFKNCPARLKHYGYMGREARVAKLDFYTAIDWKNAAEDCYRHMCQGDSPKIEELPRVKALADRGILNERDLDHILNVPADAIFVHAGPVRLTPWEEMRPWEMSDWAKQRA